jgi:hypothetical protein
VRRDPLAGVERGACDFEQLADQHLPLPAQQGGAAPHAVEPPSVM